MPFGTLSASRFTSRETDALKSARGLFPSISQRGLAKKLYDEHEGIGSELNNRSEASIYSSLRRVDRDLKKTEKPGDNDPNFDDAKPAPEGFAETEDDSVDLDHDDSIDEDFSDEEFDDDED